MITSSVWCVDETDESAATDRFACRVAKAMLLSAAMFMPETAVVAVADRFGSLTIDRISFVGFGIRLILETGRRERKHGITARQLYEYILESGSCAMRIFLRGLLSISDHDSTILPLPFLPHGASPFSYQTLEGLAVETVVCSTTSSVSFRG